MEFLRTPDDRFQNLPGFEFAPHYLQVPDGEGGELRLHYLDENHIGADQETILCMHGEPSWCYLYRKMIPILAAAGHRLLAPDLIGFGRSDKPARREDYTYQSHVDWMTSWLNSVDGQNLTLICQDWGGLIGLRLAAENPDRFKRIVVANTGLPIGQGPMSDAFMAWRKFSQEAPQFPVGGIINSATTSELSNEIISAYDAPFPDDSFKEGARQFPILVPISPEDPAVDANKKAWEVLRKWQKPFLTAFSDQDPVTKGGDVAFQKQIPGASGQAHTTIAGAGHFLQEDKGEELATVVVDFMAAR